MTKYFSQDTPLAGLERMMMSVPGFQKRGGGMMVLCRFHYKKRMWTAPTAGAICGTPVRNLFAHTFRSGWKQGLLAIRSLRRDASAWQATRSYGSGPALFPKGIRFLLRWNRPIGTGCLSGRRPAQPLSAPRSWRRFICSPPASGSGGECFPIYLTAGSTSPPFPCGGSTRETIRCTEQPRASTAGSCSLPPQNWRTRNRLAAKPSVIFSTLC